MPVFSAAVKPPGWLGYAAFRLTMGVYEPSLHVMSPFAVAPGDAWSMMTPKEPRPTKPRILRGEVEWWLGAPIAVALLTWGPYWVRNLAIGRKDWTRIPALAATVFDLTAYLQPIGQAMTGVVTAHLIGPFALLMRLIALTFPNASAMRRMSSAKGPMRCAVTTPVIACPIGCR